MSNETRNVSVSIGQDGTVVCDPDPAIVKGKNVMLTFQLLTDGWAFADTDAIVVQNPGDDFPYRSWTIRPGMANLLDVHKTTGDFKYTVNVYQVATGRTVAYDPIIRNDE